MTYTELTTKLTETLQNIPLVARVLNDDIFEIDQAKKGTFPLALFYVESVQLTGSIVSYNVNLLVADILDVNKESGQDNKDFIWNESLQIINNLHSRLERGDLFSDLIRQIDASTVTPFTDRFDQGLAGMEVTFLIETNNTMTVC